MTGHRTRLAGAVLALSLGAAPAWAETTQQSPPLTVADTTALAAFGRGGLSPDGRWAIWEKRGPYDTTPRFDFEWRSAWAIMDLWVADLRDPAAAPRRLLPQEPPGLQRLGWSPSGDRLLVTRFRDGRLEPGVVRMADGAVLWSGLTLDVPRTGAQAAWTADGAVILLVRPGRDLPAALAYQGATQGRLTEAWERTARGREPSRTVLDASNGVAGTPAARSSVALVRLDVQSGAVRSLAEGGVTDFALSPDGRTLAVVTGEEVAPLGRDEVVQFESPFRQRLSLVDLETGAVRRPVPDREIAPGLLRWSPNAREVLVWARADAAGWRDGSLMAVGAGGARRLRMDGLDPGAATRIVLGVKADWIGRTPVVHARSGAEGRADWHALSADAPPRALTAALRMVPDRLAGAGSDTVQLFADGGYWTVGLSGARRVTPAGEGLRPVAVSDSELASRLKSNEAPRQAWAVARGADGGSWVVDRGGARRLGPASGTVDQVLAASGSAELFLRRAGVSEQLLLRTADGERALDVVNGALAGTAFPAPERIRHRDLDGRETESFLFLPPDGTPVRGVLVKVYPGATDDGRWPGALALTYGMDARLFSGAGYAVLSPATPQTGALADRGDNLVRSVDLAVDAALAAHPELPADRLAVFGHSFGGYATLEIASRTRRYRAYIASSSFSDMIGVWGELEPTTRLLPEDGGMVRAAQGWAETGQAALPGTPWSATDAYVASSPYLRADRIRDPVLLLAADMDFVPLSQAERMYSALLRTGGTARLVTYWGEHHNLWSPANIEDRFGQIIDWLAVHLEPGAAAPVASGGPADGPGPGGDG